MSSPRRVRRPVTASSGTNPTHTPINTHESLMGSMMARSTPRVLLHSPIVRHIVTALEIFSAFYALSLLIILCILHIRFVRRDGCASTLMHLDPVLTTHNNNINNILLNNNYSHFYSHSTTSTSTSTSTSSCSSSDDATNTIGGQPVAQQDQCLQQQSQHQHRIQQTLSQQHSVPPVIEIAFSSITIPIQQQQQQPEQNDDNFHQKHKSIHLLKHAIVHQTFRFSQERGLLLLSDISLNSLNVTVTRVTIPTSHTCLGLSPSRKILRHLIGYDTVAVNAFARMRRRIQSRDGFVLLVQSRRVLNLLHADPGATQPIDMPLASRFIVRVMRRCGAIITAVFILCTTAALVAFTLREVQVRMIKLTIDLQLIMRSQQRGYYSRVVIRYATDALVFVPIIAGMLFFLFEFFDDQALAFAVLVITWLCEFAVSGSTRHWISRSYLPKLFFFFFVAFHIYFFSFPLGFSWLSFATSLSWMVHSALAIWNHCELPLLRNEHHVRSHSLWT